MDAISNVKNENVFLILTIVFFTSLLLPNSTLPQPFGYIAAALLFMSMLLYTIFKDKIMLIPRWLLGMLAVIFIISFYHLSVTPKIGILARTTAFFSLIFINLVYLPRVIPKEYFFWWFARLSALMTCIGLIPIFGPTELFVFDLSLWPHQTTFIGFNVITGIFNNPNILGFLLLIGTICSAAEYRLHRTRISVGLFFICLVGLLLTNYTGGWLAITGFTILWLSYQALGHKGILVTTLVSSVCAGMILAVVFNLLPGPDMLQSYNLSDRKPLWLAGVAAFAKNPILGSGLGTANLMMEPFLGRLSGSSPHNSFLSMFIEAGLIGGGTYFGIHILTLTRTVKAITDEESFFLFGFVVIAVITQIFEAYSLFGLSMRSTIASIGVGYALQNTIPHCGGDNQSAR